MTMEERQEIFAKEYLSIADFCKLYNLCESNASAFMNKIRKKLTFGMNQELRLETKGRLHIQDYLDWLGVKSDRYTINKGEQEYAEVSSNRQYL